METNLNEPGWGAHNGQWQYPPLAQPPPSPYVTHESMGAVWGKIGSLDRGLQAQEIAQGQFRAEVLTRFDQLAQIMRAHRDEEHQAQPTGLNLPFSKLVMIIGAAVMAGLYLGSGGNIARGLLAALGGGS
jgi:hypothetical protein